MSEESERSHSKAVETLYNTFYFASAEDYAQLSREFLPYLEIEEDKEFLLTKLANGPILLLDFAFSSDEFDLLQPERYLSILDNALSKGKYELAYSISKASGVYNMCCRFLSYTDPKQIVEILQDFLYGKEIVTCYVPFANVDQMLYYGIIPYPDIIKHNEPAVQILELYKQGFTETEINYWTKIDEPLNLLNRVGFWSFVTLDYVKQETRIGNSYSALLLFPELLYRSMRPRTDMGSFRTAVSNTYGNPDDIPNKKIAVTRYSQGMSKGLFYGERPVDICGLFYYAEADSTTFLSYNTVFTAFNKTVAALRLLRKKEDKDLSVVLRRLSLNYDAPKKQIILKHIKGQLPADLRFSPSEAENLLLFEGGNEYIQEDKAVYLGATTLDLYAYEDPLDQPLCKLAARLGYDIIILTHMVGSHQVVTEILDTREDSLKHLWFLE